MTKKTNLSKKELKKKINKSGFFFTMPLEIDTNVSKGDDTKNVPEGMIKIKGLASNGELNRNGYIIREKAWKKAIAGYMENPVILLQHEMSDVIGKGTMAKVTKLGLEVAGYIDDALTGGRIGNGLLRAISTGHIPLEVEFEETKTGRVLSEAEFIAEFNPDRSFWTGELIPPEGWVMAVIKLEFVEWSIVTIGSVRKALITEQNAIKNYFQNKYEVKTNDEDGEMKEVETKEGEKVEIPATEKPVSDAEKEGAEELPKEDKSDGEAENAKADDDTSESSESDDSKQSSENSDEKAEDEVKADENAVDDKPEDQESKDEGDTAEKSDSDDDKQTESDDKSEEAESESDKLKVSSEAFSKLSQKSKNILTALDLCEIEGDEVKDGKKVEAESKTESDDETKSDDKAEDKADEKSSEETEVETDDVKNISTDDLKVALIEIAKLNSVQASEIKKLHERFDELPNKKGMTLVGQFGKLDLSKTDEKKTEDNKPKSSGIGLASLFDKKGISYTK